MVTVSIQAPSSEGSRIPVCRVGTGTSAVACGLACLASAWIAAGSVGPLGHGLRFALVWLLMGGAVLAAWPGWGTTTARLVLTVAGAAALAVGTVPMAPAVTVLAVGLFAALLSLGRGHADRPVLTAVAAAIVLFGIFRLAVQAIAPLWLVCDGLGRVFGRVAGGILGTPLHLGATYGGIDFLVLMSALFIFLGLYVRPGWGMRAAVGAGLVIAGQGVYLLLLGSSNWLMEVIAQPAKPDLPFAQLPPWSLAEAVRFCIPWHLPAVAMLIHVVTAGCALRMALRAGPATGDPAAPAFAAPPRGKGPAAPAAARPASGIGRGLAAAALLLATALPFVVMWPAARYSLAGRKIVAYEKGFLNWLKARHGDYGRLSVGMYGLLPEYVAALGGRCVISPDLSEADLADADVLLIFYPDEPWAPGQLERIWAFVRSGGSLAVFGEHTVGDAGGDNRFNEVLRPTGLQVAFDSATFLIGGWLQSYEARFHPATAGVGDERNQFGVVIGASVDMPWRACPLLVGRWGWNDPGDLNNAPSLMGNHLYDPGERLGDIVLAAEVPFGAGRVIAFGDTSSMTNGIMPGAHVFTSRLLAYLAGRSDPPQTLGRALLGLLVIAAIKLILLTRPAPAQILPVPAALIVATLLCLRANERAIADLPDGRLQTPNHLAYIDTGHLSAASDESWRDEGLGGLILTLTRNGYLVLHLDELTDQRLQRAGLLVSVAPARRYTPQEREALARFIEGGGIFIMTAGLEDPRREAALDLMAEYGFHIGDQFPDARGRIPEPEPLGHFKSPYFNGGDYLAYVRFWAAWPILSTRPGARAIAYGRGERNVILTREVGRGRVIFVGDTYFATNKNLERIDGQPIEGLRENADFWRWLLSFVRGQPVWVPPNPAAAAAREGRP